MTKTKLFNKCLHLQQIQENERQFEQENRRLTVESYQRALVAQSATSGSPQTIAYNNTIAKQTDTSDDHTIDDMIFTFINKINLGLVPTSGDPLLSKMKVSKLKLINK